MTNGLEEEDPLDRELQSTELARIMSASPYPVVFLGYVVTTPRAKRRESVFDLHFISCNVIAAPYQILVEDGRMHDIDEEDSDRWWVDMLTRMPTFFFLGANTFSIGAYIVLPMRGSLEAQ